MADWTDINDSQLDPDAPLTSELAYAWRDNPVAIAEGHDDAPRIQPAALGTLLGVITIPNSVGTAVGLTGLDGKSVLSFGFAVGVGGGSIQMRKSTDNGATWGGWSDLIWMNVAGGMADYLFDLTSGRLFQRTVQVINNSNELLFGRDQTVSTNWAGGPVTAFQFRNNTSVRFTGPVPVFGVGRGGTI